MSKKVDFKEVELYFVADMNIARSIGVDLFETIKKALDCGVDLIQYRDKISSKKQFLYNAERIKEIVERYNVGFLINDHIDVSLAIEADGVHIGQDDFDVKYLKNMLEKFKIKDFIIGKSTHNLEEIKEAIDEKVTYFNIGPIFPTKTKEHLERFLGVDIIKEVKNLYKDSIFTVMGGINKNNLKDVILSGADRVAVVTAILNKGDICENVKELKKLIKEYKKER